MTYTVTVEYAPRQLHRVYFDTMRAAWKYAYRMIRAEFYSIYITTPTGQDIWV